MSNLNIRYDKLFIETALSSLRLKCYEGDLSREILVTPYAGAYGTAGYVATINGTPPLATFVLLTSNSNMMVGISPTGTTKIATDSTGNKDLQWIREYLIAHITRNSNRA